MDWTYVLRTLADLGLTGLAEDELLTDEAKHIVATLAGRVVAGMGEMVKVCLQPDCAEYHVHVFQACLVCLSAQLTDALNKSVVEERRSGVQVKQLEAKLLEMDRVWVLSVLVNSCRAWYALTRCARHRPLCLEQRLQAKFQLELSLEETRKAAATERQKLMEDIKGLLKANDQLSNLDKRYSVRFLAATGVHRSSHRASLSELTQFSRIPVWFGLTQARLKKLGDEKEALERRVQMEVRNADPSTKVGLKVVSALAPAAPSGTAKTPAASSAAGTVHASPRCTLDVFWYWSRTWACTRHFCCCRCLLAEGCGFVAAASVDAAGNRPRNFASAGD
jgi:hypothetical protein